MTAGFVVGLVLFARRVRARLKRDGTRDLGLFDEGVAALSGVLLEFGVGGGGGGRGSSILTDGGRRDGGVLGEVEEVDLYRSGNDALCVPLMSNSLIGVAATRAGESNFW